MPLLSAIASGIIHRRRDFIQVSNENEVLEDEYFHFDTYY